MGDKRKQDNRGFSLVEVVVSAAILAIIGSVIFCSFSMAVRMNARAKQTYRAANYAQKAMEYLMTDEDIETAVKSAVQGVCSNANVASLTAAGNTLKWSDVSNKASGAVCGSTGRWPADGDSDRESRWNTYWSGHDLGIATGDSVTVDSVTASVNKGIGDTIEVTIEFQVTASADGAEVTLSGKRTINLTLTT
ncbi:MAG: type II secretion system GspH family protein [Lachnospiraceae bacterium]|nr:type II secretion system GspH family protein [Lachnospiraceae bacterium]